MRIPLSAPSMREVAHPHMAHAAIGVAADRHAVSRVEMVVRDGHVARDGPVGPALIATLSSPVSMSQYVMVTLVDDDGSMPSVLRAVFGVLILTPQAVKPLVLLHRHVEVRRIAQRDAIQREVVALPHHQQPRHALREILDLRLLRQVPPRDVLARAASRRRARRSRRRP